MGWGRMDDGFHDHPKVLELSLEAVGLWTLTWTWAHRHKGSFGVLGHVPEHLAQRFAGRSTKKLASQLVEAGMWEVESAIGGWVIHDFVDYLPASERPTTSSEVRAARSEAGKRGAASRWGNKEVADDKQPDGKLPSDVDSKPMPPSRPVPTQPDQQSNPLPRKRATRIPDDFTVTPEMIEWKHQNTPDIDGRLETAKFVDFWTGKSGKDATKLDWVATWRNWMRNAQERTGKANGHKPTLGDKAAAWLAIGETTNELESS